ncbi:MAG: prephenate dehydrogenase [Pseudomonadota bacterium]|nr:prephenate dehydrogenase [Pseudomonadota bacterium]|tara:strand:+ start:337 stop:1209 length:873 start_codon:yes stop_codon:yes gene_type:complete
MGIIGFKNILVVGLGLIGGSILKKLSTINSKALVYGFDKKEETVREAFKLGLIKNQDNEFNLFKNDILIIFSVPTLALEEAYYLIEGKITQEQAIFSDTLSSKTELLKFLNSNPKLSSKFLMSHPIAGSERSGLKNSKASLFEKKIVLISRVSGQTKRHDFKKLKDFWVLMGAEVLSMRPEAHDKIFSLTSHLPHIVTYALMDLLYKNLSEKTFLYSGGSLEGYTRVASSDPRMWKDIMLSNKEEILKAIDGFTESLDHIYKLIESNDQELILSFLKNLKSSRDNLLDKN